MHASSLSVYPEPHVPKNPVLGWAAFNHGDATLGTEIPNILSLPHVRYVTSARIAIAWALQKLNIGPGDEVLIPDYHCLSMVEPVHMLGATARYYSLNPQLSVALDELERADLSRVKAILVTHFFGFPQPMKGIDAFCRRHGIPIVEDCAHAMFGSADGRPIGSWGEFAAASLMKFFPVYDGGCLASTKHDLSTLNLKPASGRFQVKSLFNTIERGLRYNRFPGIQMLASFSLGLKDKIWGAYKQLRFGSQSRAFQFQDPASSDGSSGLDPRWLDRSMSKPSLFLLHSLSTKRVMTKRRHNYQRLAKGLADLPGATLLFPELPGDVVPYVFPLLIKQPAMIFETLRRKGFPLFRWEALSEELDAEIHLQALRYAAGLFQIPCHQELSEDDLNWMIQTLQSTIKDSA